MEGKMSRNKIHLLDTDGRYACIKAFSVTEGRATKKIKDVDCENCKRIIKRKQSNTIKTPAERAIITLKIKAVLELLLLKYSIEDIANVMDKMM